MNKTIFLVLALGSIVFAEEAARIVTKTRVIGTEIMGVSKCETPEGTTNATTVLVTGNDGQLYNAPATYLGASSKARVKKCLVVEDYQVDVTGSMWNTKESERPGTATQRVEIREEVIEGSNSQTIRDQKDTYFGGDNTVSVAINILEGLKSRSKQECDARRAQLLQQATKNSKCVTTAQE